MIPLFFNIHQGEKKLTKSEISESTYVTLRAPVYISVIIFIVGVAISIYGVINQVGVNTKSLENKLSVSEYRQDRKLDSLSSIQYRKEIRRDLTEIIRKLDEINGVKKKSMNFDEDE